MDESGPHTFPPPPSFCDIGLPPLPAELGFDLGYSSEFEIDLRDLTEIDVFCSKRSTLNPLEDASVTTESMFLTPPLVTSPPPDARPSVSVSMPSPAVPSGSPVVEVSLSPPFPATSQEANDYVEVIFPLVVVTLVLVVALLFILCYMRKRNLKVSTVRRECCLPCFRRECCLPCFQSVVLPVVRKRSDADGRADVTVTRTSGDPYPHLNGGQQWKNGVGQKDLKETDSPIRRSVLNPYTPRPERMGGGAPHLSGGGVQHLSLQHMSLPNQTSFGSIHNPQEQKMAILAALQSIQQQQLTRSGLWKGPPRRQSLPAILETNQESDCDPSASVNAASKAGSVDLLDFGSLLSLDLDIDINELWQTLMRSGHLGSSSQLQLSVSSSRSPSQPKTRESTPRIETHINPETGSAHDVSVAGLPTPEPTHPHLRPLPQTPKYIPHRQSCPEGTLPRTVVTPTWTYHDASSNPSPQPRPSSRSSNASSASVNTLPRLTLLRSRSTSSDVVPVVGLRLSPEGAEMEKLEHIYMEVDDDTKKQSTLV